MLLIADSGSTKTTWCLCDDAASMRLVVETQGINPVHQSEEQIRGVLIDELLSAYGDRLTREGEALQVFFYGAGCIGDACKHLKNIIGEVLGKDMCTAIEVESDLLGAARALCGSQPGVACILGTGANSCWYDGDNIAENVPPLGYILGDEGSGAVLGKLFFNAMFKGRLPETIKTLYLKESGLQYVDIIERTYRKPLANRFLASTSVFIKQHIDDCEQLRQLVIDNFRDFFRNNVARYSNASSLASNFIGSMACVYEEELREAAVHEGFHVGKVAKSPMDGLVAFHGG